MSKNDLWDSSIFNHENFKNEMKNLNAKFELEIINVVNFCNILKEEDNLLKGNKEKDKNEYKENNRKKRKFIEN